MMHDTSEGVKCSVEANYKATFSGKIERKKKVYLNVQNTCNVSNKEVIYLRIYSVFVSDLVISVAIIDIPIHVHIPTSLF